MKKLFLFVLMLVSFQLSAQEMLVGSYNIRYKNQSDSLQGNAWNKRCQVICDQVNFLSPMIFGAQEVLHTQLLDLLDGLDGYDYIGVGRDDGKQAGEYEPIFYKKNKLKLLDYGNFWLSETPEKPGLGWDAACVRICTWGKFTLQDSQSSKRHGLFNRRKNKNQFVFYYFNLHMDHVGKVARREAAKLVVARIRKIAQGAPVILTGDFNVDQNDEIYTIFSKSGLLKDSYNAARIRFAENGTFNAFETDFHTDSRIDHVFVSPDTQVDAYGVMTNSYWTSNAESQVELKSANAPQEISFSPYTRRNPSDHYPVFVKLSFPQK